VPDYAKLADIARERQEAERLVSERHKQLRPDPCSFFEQVKAHLMNGMEKANVELRRRGVALLGRNHLPGFDDEVFSLMVPIRCAEWDWDFWEGDAGSPR
jgi:hypothetical protein